MRIRPFADRALLLETTPEDVLGLHEALRRAALPEVEELVPAARTLLLRLRPGSEPARLAERLRALPRGESAAAEAGTVRLPVRYDGEDLAALAALLGVPPAELAARHAAAAWRVAFLGFAPGFAYLRCEDPLFRVPRLPEPRTRVPAGSVALAGPYSGVYPRASPGGWRLIGRSEARLWDAERDPPALLQPGCRVRFTPLPRESLRLSGAAAEPEDEAVRGAAAEPDGGRPGGGLELLRPGLQVLVQDLGRPGYAATGAGRSGAADLGALRAANRLLGNEPQAAALEIVGGAELAVLGRCLAALSGAVADAVVEEGGEEREIPRGRPFLLRPGELLRIAPARRGLRSYLALRGGVDARPVLGSRSSDTLSGLGPPPLRAGDRVPIGPRPRAAVQPQEALPDPPAPGDVVEVGLLPGPRADRLAPPGLSALMGAPWTVTADSDRIGLRLGGRDPLAPPRGGELESEGVVAGAVQLPPGGRPVVFLADHPVTGGYPVVGAVPSGRLDLLGQLPPGALVRFVPAGPPR
ncbi:MAG: carboxyltransferase domain-containing protein [Pseudoclavibacter sp.]|nr:carboxyltransferase domain-containing protein [Pseudoclavibacter sp.]